MRKKNVDSIVAGEILAKTLYTQDGRVLLTAGAELRGNFIGRIKLNGISEIFIEDDISEGIVVIDTICEETRQEAKQLIRNLIEGYTFSETLNVGNIREIVYKIIEELLSNEDILLSLSEIRSVDDYTFEHSVHVCILSLITGIDLGFDMVRLRDLGVGALLHDIGKLKVPQEILKKPSQLTVEEFEEIKKHTIYGYEILKDNKQINIASAYIAFGHHERFDGSGYPLQLKGENIHLCARIVAIADVFDALSSNRVYRRKLHINEVVEYITSLSAQHFDKHIVESFVKHVIVYGVGTGVILNTLEKGIVVRLNKALPTRPVIRVIFDKAGKKLTQYYEIDLSTKVNVSIIDYYDFDEYIY